MKLIPRTEFDSLVFAHSREISLEERVGGVLRISFGPAQIFLSEEAAREFLYQLTDFFAQKDLAEYDSEGEFDASLQESREALATLSLLRQPSS
jgi:hypothetical protein